MRPTLFDLDLPVLGTLTFPAYTTLLMVAFLVCVLVARREGERLGLDPAHVVDLGIVVLVLGIAGSRALAVLTDGQLMDFVHLCTAPKQVEARDAMATICTTNAQCGYDYLCDVTRHACYPPRDCLAALKFWRGGLTFYGGLLLAIPGGLWFARRRGMDPRVVADLAAPLIMLGLAIGKIGCFLNGCCYGAPTRAWVGVTFPNHPGPTHPTQLYESATALGVFAFLWLVVRRRKRFDGEVLAWLLVIYGTARTFLELFRADPRGSLGPLSTSQAISIPLVLVGIFLLVRDRRRLKA